MEKPLIGSGASPTIIEESNMDGINSDKVSIQVGEGGGRGGSDLGAMAAIAALGQRNQGSDNAALIAALGGRNERHGDDGFGLGGGGGGILGLLAILGLLRGRGGLGGDGGEDCGETARTAILQTLMEGQSDLRQAVPTAALETQNAICRSTGEISNAINQSQLASLAAFSNLKDVVSNTGTILLGAANQNTKEILGAICALSGKIDANQILDLQRQLGVAQANEREERGHSRSREVEFNLTQNVNQQQLQTQQQRIDDERYNRLFGIVANIGNQVQRSRSDQDVINFGSMLGSATQAAANTQVR